MKKTEQRAINIKVEEAIERYNTFVNTNHLKKIGGLRTCNAIVYSTTRYIVLQSYGTVVAFIDKDNAFLYDFSRLVYGYTATSSQHISKFAHEYDIDNILTWKEVK